MSMTKQQREEWGCYAWCAFGLLVVIRVVGYRDTWENVIGGWLGTLIVVVCVIRLFALAEGVGPSDDIDGRP